MTRAITADLAAQLIAERPGVDQRLARAAADAAVAAAEGAWLVHWPSLERDARRRLDELTVGFRFDTPLLRSASAPSSATADTMTDRERVARIAVDLAELGAGGLAREAPDEATALAWLRSWAGVGVEGMVDQLRAELAEQTRLAEEAWAKRRLYFHEREVSKREDELRVKLANAEVEIAHWKEGRDVELDTMRTLLREKNAELADLKARVSAHACSHGGGQ